MSIKISQNLGIDADKALIQTLNQNALALYNTPLLHKQHKNIRWLDVLKLLSEERIFIPYTAQPKELINKLNNSRPFTLLTRRLNCSYTQLNRLCNKAKLNPDEISLGAGLKLMEFHQSGEAIKLIEDINLILKVDISKYWRFCYV